MSIEIKPHAPEVIKWDVCKDGKVIGTVEMDSVTCDKPEYWAMPGDADDADACEIFKTKDKAIKFISEWHAKGEK